MTFDGHRVQAADTVVIRSRMQATHAGEFLGVAPTGRRITWNTLELAWVRDGRVVGQ